MLGQFHMKYLEHLEITNLLKGKLLMKNKCQNETRPQKNPIAKSV